jgi:hypothetical protein
MKFDVTIMRLFDKNDNVSAIDLADQYGNILRHITVKSLKQQANRIKKYKQHIKRAKEAEK